VKIVHEEPSDELVAVQNYLGLFEAETLLQVFFQLDQEIVAVEYYVPARPQVLQNVGDLPHQEPRGLLVPFPHALHQHLHFPQTFSLVQG
jgi:hypothetical protein